jgi:hypothetical protein
MESLILTCLQAQLLAGRVYAQENIAPKDKNDLVWEIKQIAPKECKLYDKRTENSNQSVTGRLTYSSPRNSYASKERGL